MPHIPQPDQHGKEEKKMKKLFIILIGIVVLLLMTMPAMAADDLVQSVLDG